MVRWRRITATAACVAAVLALAGCLGTGDDGSDQAAALELEITGSLPQQLRRYGAGAVLVRFVDCVEESDGQYSCLARVQGSDGFGNPVTESLPIDASCGDGQCIWHASS